MIRNIIKNYIKPREDRVKNVEYINSFLIVINIVKKFLYNKTSIERIDIGIIAKN